MFFSIVISLLIVVYTIIICYYSIRQYGRILNPLLVAVVPFCVACLLTAFLSDISPQEKETGLIWLIVGIVIYLLSFSLATPIRIVCNHIAYDNTPVVYCYNKKTVNFLINILVAMLIISFIFSFCTVYSIAGSLKAILVNSTWVRFQYLEKSAFSLQTVAELFLALNILVISCLFPKAIELKCKHIKFKLIISIIIIMMKSIVTMSKEAFIVNLLIIVFSYSQFAGNVKIEFDMLKRSLKWFIILLFILLVFVSVQRDYLSYRYESYLDAIIGTVLEYVSIPIISFCLIIGIEDFLMGALCFRPIFNMLSYFGIGERISIVQSAVQGGANVYSTFGNMYRDFGSVGIIVLSVFFGLFFGLLYSNKTESRFSRIAINSIIEMNMVFTFYDLKMIQTIYLFSILYAWMFDRILAKKLYLSPINLERK